ncbi:ParA family protein [Nocardia sp. NPDC004260]
MTTSETPTRIVFFGASGSTGKTTCAVNQACEWAKRGLVVRFWDGDIQGDGSTYFHYMEPPYVVGEVLAEVDAVPDPTSKTGRRVPTMREIELTVGRETAEEAEQTGGLWSDDPVQAEWLRRIKLVPSGIGTTGTTLGDAVTVMERDSLGHEKVLEKMESIDEGRAPEEIPDIEIFDLAGTPTPLHYLALKWAARGGTKGGRSGVILVVTPDDKAMGKHFHDALNRIRDTAKYHPIEAVAIIPTRISSNRGRFYVEMYTNFKNDAEFSPLVTPPVREAVYAGESYASREPLLLYVPEEGITEDQAAVADWLKEHGVIAA